MSLKGFMENLLSAVPVTEEWKNIDSQV